MAMISPVAAANPQARALPLPERFCLTIRMSGRSRRAVATVSSTEFPSTRMTSCSPAGSLAKTCGRLRASLSAGMTTLTFGQG